MFLCDIRRVATSFVGVENVAKADAPSVKRTIDGVVDKHFQLSKATLLKKLVGFGCDVAAVVIGVNNGVATLFRREQACVQAIHCFTHRLELAYRQALGHLPVNTELSGLLLSLYLLYHHSPLIRSNPKAALDTLVLL